MALLLACFLAIGGTAVAASAGTDARQDPDLVARVRRLDCAHVSGTDVRDVLSRAPAPRIVLLQGSLALVTMEPFARFLVSMGYPVDRLRDPRDGGLSHGSFTDSATLAGELAFDYERSGMEPMLIGHSQGGMLAIRTLHELAGAFHEALHVVDPASGEPLERTSIVDPRTGVTRPVVGLRVAYAAALATGWLPRLLLGQWSMLARLRKIPDTVEDFTGFILPHDPIAGNLLGDVPYATLGSARVRNVELPSGYHHVGLPDVAHLAEDTATRSAIDAWSPGSDMPKLAGDASNLVHATDIWYSVKQHWCEQAQRLLSASSS